MYPLETRELAVEAVAAGFSLTEAAELAGCSRTAVVNWAKAAGVAPPELELRNAVLEGTIDILKKDPGADLSALTAAERAALADRLRGRFGLRAALAALSLPRSTFYDRLAAASAPDPYAALRPLVRAAFAASGGAYGYRRVPAALARGAGAPPPTQYTQSVYKYTTLRVHRPLALQAFSGGKAAIWAFPFGNFSPAFKKAGQKYGASERRPIPVHAKRVQIHHASRA